MYVDYEEERNSREKIFRDVNIKYCFMEIGPTVGRRPQASGLSIFQISYNPCNLLHPFRRFTSYIRNE